MRIRSLVVCALTAVLLAAFAPLLALPLQAQTVTTLEVIYYAADEGVEEMTLRLSNPEGAYLSDGIATGYISDNSR